MKFEDLKNDLTLVEELEITNYLTLAEKSILIKGIEDKKGLIDNILVQNESGLWQIDFAMYELHTINQLCNWYLNIDFGDNFTSEDYDFIKKNNIDSKVPDDANKFIKMLNKCLVQEIEQRNSIQNVIIKTVEKLLTTINDTLDDKKLKSLAKQFEKIKATNPELLEVVKGMSQGKVK